MFAVEEDQREEPAVYVIHENGQWLSHLRDAFETLGVKYHEWNVGEKDFSDLDLSQAPPEGVFYNRMSASSHTRGHRFAPEFTAGILEWLQLHGRTVLNSSRALTLEVNKLAQYTALKEYGVAVPKTVAVLGRPKIVEVAEREFPHQSFLLKHNRAGTGYGVRRFDDIQSLKEYVDSPDYLEPVDGIVLLQAFVEAPYFYRLEFVNGKLLYAVRIKTGSFENCPADKESCSLEEMRKRRAEPKFTVVPGFKHPYVEKIPALLAARGITIGAVEIIADEAGNWFAFDLNTNTNYNREAEETAAVPLSESGMGAIAVACRDALDREYPL